MVWRHAQPARPEGHHVQPHVGPLTAVLQQRTSYIQAYYFRLLRLTAATGKLYTNKKHELYIHMLYHNTAWHQSLQSSTERHRTGNTNPTWSTALNSHSPWACLSLAIPLTTHREGLIDLQYLLSLWMYVECKDVCNNFRSKHKTCRLNLLFSMVTLAQF